jgi:RsiW-degrading membrane proteinase PrsW (M82 family)
MLIAASIVASFIPMVVYLFIIWKMDKYEPEPLKFVISHFLWGAFGAIIFAVLGSSAIEWLLDIYLGQNYYPLLMTIITAPVLEEITKGIYFRKSYSDKRMDNITDGLVYGAAIGLGFGMTENFFYYITYGDTFSEWFGLVLIRTCFSALMHCISTGIFGAILGYLKFSTVKYKRIIITAGISLSIFIHAVWNIFVSFNSTYIFGFLFLLILICLFILMFKISLLLERRILQTELIDEMPEDIRMIVASDKRFKEGWIEEPFRKSFIKYSTMLAFRKRQLKIYRNDESLIEEIKLLREKVINLLKSKEKTE